MSNFRFILDTSSRKYICPDCGKKRFVRFIDLETGELLPEQFGRCDKGDGHYFLSPYSDGYAKGEPKDWKPQPRPPQAKPKPVYFDSETFRQTLQPERYKINTFIQNLLNRSQFPFDTKDIIEAIKLYRLGTVANGYRAGAITFPFIDVAQNIRAVQVKHFDEQNHTTGTDFLHSMIEKHLHRNSQPLPDWLTAYIQQDGRVSCLFGEHLLSKYTYNPVMLVEAPKTAIYGTLYFGLPDTPNTPIWLAVYNKSSLSFEKIKVLQGREIIVFPDLSKDGSTFKEWKTKIDTFKERLPATVFKFSDLLEQSATPELRAKGADLADVLIMQDWKQYRPQARRSEPEPAPVEPVQPFAETVSEPVEHLQETKEIDWGEDLNQLEAYFSGLEIPVQPLRLDKASNIINPRLFIESHISILKANNGNKRFLPYLSRLQEYQNILKTTI